MFLKVTVSDDWGGCYIRVALRKQVVGMAQADELILDRVQCGF
jgi:hypothetical protein